MDGMDEIVQCLSTLSKGQAKAIFAGLTAWPWPGAKLTQANQVGPGLGPPRSTLT